MPRVRLCLPLLALLLTPFACAQERPDWLCGVWRYEQEGLTLDMTLAADGQITLVVAAFGESERSVGRWSVVGGNLRTTIDGANVDYELERREGGIVLSGGDLDTVMSFRRTGDVAPARDPEPHPGGGDATLVGKWLHDGDFLNVTLVFLPDGRYGAEIDVDGTKVPESGTYRLEGRRLTLDPVGLDAVTYDISLGPGSLEVAGGNLEAPMAYRKVPGSEATVVEEARAADAAKATDDARWRERLAVAPMKTQPPHAAVGEIPADPNVANVFDDPTVFVEPQIYLTLGVDTYRFQTADGRILEDRNSTKWFLLPTGRFFYKSVMHYPSSAQQEVTIFWGRYTIEKGDAMVIETDKGERHTLALIDGRRNLRWDESIYGNVHWENESLEREMGK